MRTALAPSISMVRAIFIIYKSQITIKLISLYISEFMQVMTGKNFYDFTFKRHFVFASDAVPRHCWTPACRAHDCPSRRMRLHRRIEWHFERLFEQMCRPLHVWHKPLTSLASTTLTCPAIPSAHSSTCTTSKHTVNIQNKTTDMDNKRNTKFTQTTNIEETKIIPHKPCSGCYHSVFRPRFPKWVPIFTLYRELVQNPFRRRTRLMITHNWNAWVLTITSHFLLTCLFTSTLPFSLPKMLLIWCLFTKLFSLFLIYRLSYDSSYWSTKSLKCHRCVAAMK